VRRSRSLRIPFALVTALGATCAAAQEAPTLNLFGPAPIEAGPDVTLGMRSETVGAVVYVSLSLDAASSLRASSAVPHVLQIALPAGKSVNCEFRSEARPDGLVVLTGATTDDSGGRCDLVVDNGRVTGEIEIASGRYRIVPLGSGTTHAVVEVRTEGFPNEQEPKQPS